MLPWFDFWVYIRPFLSFSRYFIFEILASFDIVFDLIYCNVGKNRVEIIILVDELN